MNRHLKQEIKTAFQNPMPDQQEKMRFLRTLPRSRISMWRFLVTQIAYLRKRTLVFTVLFLLPALAGVRHTDRNILWFASALIPFLGMLAVTESTRSTMFGMHEFEMAARFSMKSVMLARMSVLGLLDAFVLCCLIPICRISGDILVIQTGMYLLVPYLLTVNISLCITRRFHGREALYGCLCAAVLVSGGTWTLHMFADFVYRFRYVHWWIILAVFLMGRMAQEIRYTVGQTGA